MDRNPIFHSFEVSRGLQMQAGVIQKRSKLAGW
jgi:hypothetical protein